MNLVCQKIFIIEKKLIPVLEEIPIAFCYYECNQQTCKTKQLIKKNASIAIMEKGYILTHTPKGTRITKKQNNAYYGVYRYFPKIPLAQKGGENY